MLEHDWMKVRRGIEIVSRRDSVERVIKWDKEDGKEELLQKFCISALTAGTE